MYWIEVVNKVKSHSEVTLYKDEYKEANEILAIVVPYINTARKSLNKK